MVTRTASTRAVIAREQTIMRVVVIGCLILLTLCTSHPPLVIHSDNQDKHTIYVVSHGWHAGLVLPKEVMQDDLSIMPLYFNDVEYYEFGWGDSGFYQHPDITVSLAAKALFWSSDSVMHVVAVPRHPNDYFANSTVIPMKLSQRQIELMVAFIAKSFAVDDNNRWRRIGPGLYGESRFFHANGIYHGLYTCNSWTAEALQVAGVPMNQWLSLTSGSVTLQVKQAIQSGSLR